MSLHVTSKPFVKVHFCGLKLKKMFVLDIFYHLLFKDEIMLRWVTFLKS